MAQGSVFALLMDQQGGSREIGWQEIRHWRPEAGLLWLVTRPDGEESQRWLRLESGLDPVILKLLVRGDNRPQCHFFREGTLLCLHAANHGLQNRAEEMVCVNIWIDDHRVIIMRPAAVMVFEDLRLELKRGHEQLHNAGELVGLVIQRIIARQESLVLEISHDVDDLEDTILLDANANPQQDLVAVRHRLIILRRHLLPQAEALNALQHRRLPWLDEACRQAIHDVRIRLLQYLGDLDSARERASLMQDEITNNQNVRLNETMKITAVFTAYLLPVNAITSLLGTNIEGIPFQAGGDYPYGFFLECTMLITVMIVSYFIFKRKKWFS